nr:hypothetical protein [Tanacetum cinerariifolium]
MSLMKEDRFSELFQTTVNNITKEWEYPDVNSPSQEKSKEVSQAKEDLINSIQTFLDKFDCIPFEERPKIYLETWYNFFKYRHAKPEGSNELFQKFLEDLKELAEYKESLDNSSKEIAVSNSNQEKEEPPQDSDIHQLIEECCVEVCEKQKQSMEDTMLESVKICQEKEFLYIHDNVDDLIESALNTKLLSINSQRLEKEQQEVKNVVEQPTERGNLIESLQNFKVIHKSSISLNTSQISSIHAVTPILSTKESEHPLSLGYEHLSITPETESDKVTESNAKNLLPIPSECEVTLEDKRKCDLPISENSPICDNHSDIFSDSDNDDDISVYDDFEDIEYVEASLSDPEIVSVEEENGVEEENVVQQEEEEIDLEDISQIQDIVLHEKLLSITHLISNIESLNDNSTPDCVLNSFVSDNSLLDNFSPGFKIFCDHTEETRSEADLFLASDNSIPPGIENVDDSEGDIRFLEELLIDDSILSHESSDSNFKDNPSIPRPPPELPDAETEAGEEIPVVMNDKDKFDKDYYFLMIDKVFSFLSAESEDTIFDPGMDCAQFAKNQPKTGQYQHKIRNQKKKPD